MVRCRVGPVVTGDLVDTTTDEDVPVLRGRDPKRRDRLQALWARFPWRAAAGRCAKRTGSQGPHSDSRQKCDLALGDPPAWAIEIKMAVCTGDNGKPDHLGVKDLLSPFDCDRRVIVFNKDNEAQLKNGIDEDW